MGNGKRLRGYETTARPFVTCKNLSKKQFSFPASFNTTSNEPMKSATSVPSLLSVFLLFSSTHVLEAEGIPFRFLLTSVTVEETDSVARLQVLRADDADHPINIDFFTEPVSATAAADYTPVAGTLTFFPGEHF